MNFFLIVMRVIVNVLLWVVCEFRVNVCVGDWCAPTSYSECGVLC